MKVNSSDGWREFRYTCLVAIRDLKSNPEIEICRPDKGSGMVILNKSDYVEKIAVILSDVSKFQRLGNTTERDHTSHLEKQLAKRRLQLCKRGDLSKEVYNTIRPVRSQNLGCMVCQTLIKIVLLYGQSFQYAQHELTRWLRELLQPALGSVSEHVIVDSFTFADAMRTVTHLNENSTMCSYDIASLFTNVPLTEVI